MVAVEPLIGYASKVPENLATKAIRMAFLKGYRVTETGEVISPHGKIRKVSVQRCKRRTPYRRFNIGLGGQLRFPVKVGELAAFQKFGEDALVDGIVTRHLDGEPLNDRPDNIGLGTKSQNMMDRDPETRHLHARKAGDTQRRFTDSEVAQIRLEHQAGDGYKVLEKRWKCSRATLSYFLSKTAKRKGLY